MNQYIYVVSTLVMHVCMVYVCSNEHIVIATHVAYFRKKACIISAGFISYPLVCSERAARATDTGSSTNSNDREAIVLMDNTHTAHLLTSALPRKWVELHAGADGGRGNAVVLCYVQI